MAEATRVDFKVFHGPNLLAPFAAVVAEMPNAYVSQPPPADLDALLKAMLPAELAARVALPVDGFEQLAAALAVALQDFRGPSGLPLQIRHPNARLCRIALGFHDTQATMMALHMGLELATIAYGDPERDAARLQARARTALQMYPVMQARQPDYITHALIRAARSRNIPVYPVATGSRVWQYGQGRAGRHCFEAANDRDSLTGVRLSRDKFTSNQLIMHLGLPGVMHGLADSLPTALQLARQIGFPVVVKPVNLGKGVGVTAQIMNEAALGAAFANANSHAPGRVLVERHVPGDDHRVTVLGGKFTWCSRRSPPRVTGDGTHTIAELIRTENDKRSAADVAAGYLIHLQIDADMLQMLAAQGLTPDSRPAPGTAVRLRSIANMATGGTVTDCTAEIHPDNRAMAEAVARGFRLDAIGIDFMTTDISKSWRDTDCAIIEINATPGFSSDGRAEIVMRSKFPEGSDGRIASVVLVGGTAAAQARVTGALSGAGPGVGETDAAATRLDGRLRFNAAATLPARVFGLLLDPACAALVIRVTPDDIARHGFPLDRCDLALIADLVPLSEPMRRLIWQCAGRVIDGVAERNLDRETLPAVLEIQRKRAPANPAHPAQPAGSTAAGVTRSP